MLPLTIVGWIVVPIAAGLGRYEMTIDENKARKNEKPQVYHFTDKFMFIWDNYEDGIANSMYYEAPNMFLQIIYWSLIRNPTNNMRISKFSCKIDPVRIKYIGSETNIYEYDTKKPQWFIAWQGPYSNLFVQFKMFGGLWRFWIGTAKIYPTDIYGVTEYRKRGAGGVTQFKRID